MLLAALPLAAALALAQSDAGSTRPPAQLEAPESLRRERQARPEDDPAEHLGLAAPEVLQAAGPLLARPGSWAEYTVRYRGKLRVRLRISILPPPPEAGEGRYWLEVASVGSDAYPTVVKVLVNKDPLAAGGVERLILYPS